MSFKTCILSGTTLGFAGSLVLSAYAIGASNRTKQKIPLSKTIQIFFIVAPVFGFGAGLGCYGLIKSAKYLKAAPRRIQVMTVLATVSLGAAINGAHKLGKHDIRHFK